MLLVEIRRQLGSLILISLAAIVFPAIARAQSGGFVDSATSAGLRPRLSPGEIQTFLPARGVFTFPSPYLTQGVRLTNSSDCGGADCVLPVGYSYWSNINNHAGSDTMLVVLGLERRKGGGGPTLFSYNKRTGETRNEGPLFSSDSPYSWNTGEGWYFSGSRPTTLYMNDGPRMLRYDVTSHEMETVFDVRTAFGNDKYIWQMHSSRDDRTHSATLRQNGTWEMLGCVVYQDGRQPLFIQKKGDFDECQIDKSGRFVVVKENVDGRDGEDNRIVDVQTGIEQVLLDANGAAGHSDLGFGYMIAEDNFNSQPGAVRRWNLAGDLRGGQPATEPGQGELVYQLSSWSSGLGHVAFGDARPDIAIDQQVACASNANRADLPRVNEIVCFPLNGSLSTLVVAPNMTDLNAPGGGSDDYAKLPKGNLDVTGEYFIWTANAGTNRLDAYIVRIPQQAFGSAPPPVPPPTSPTPPPGAPPAPPPPPPAPSPTPTPGSGALVEWTALVNAGASEGTLTKTGGCSGCPDAGAISAQRISSGDGFVSFVASDNTLRIVGLGRGDTGTDASSIGYGLRLQNGTVEVRESGQYKAEAPFAIGDVLMVAVQGGQVTYAKNGAVFYTSAVAPSYPLVVDASLYDLNATVSSAWISTTSTTAASINSTSGASRRR